MDIAFIKRLCRSLNHQRVFNAFKMGREARNSIGSWVDRDSWRRLHWTLAGRTPDEFYSTADMTEQLPV